MALKSANLQRLKWLGQSDHALIDGLRAAVAVLESEGLRFGQGTSDAFDDAAWLVLWGLDLPRDRLDDFRDARVSAIEWRRIAQLLRRRVEQRLPVSYLTGEAWLDGLRFRSDPRALIPRSLLVEALARCRDEGLIDAPLSMLDLCTGSGSILIHAGHQFADAQLFGSDRFEQALALAALNLADHGLTDRTQLRQGSGLAPWKHMRFDLILCNPPYVNQESMQSLPPEFMAEPRSALSGGVDGMDFCREFLAQAAAVLNEQGQLLLEIGNERVHFEAAFPKLEFSWIPVAAGQHMVVLISRAGLLKLR